MSLANHEGYGLPFTDLSLRALVQQAVATLHGVGDRTVEPRLDVKEHPVGIVHLRCPLTPGEEGMLPKAWHDAEAIDLA